MSEPTLRAMAAVFRQHMDAESLYRAIEAGPWSERDKSVAHGARRMLGLRMEWE